MGGIENGYSKKKEIKLRSRSGNIRLRYFLYGLTIIIYLLCPIEYSSKTYEAVDSAERLSIFYDKRKEIRRGGVF
ncbi:MAG: hypothetical protein ACP5IB_09095 [Thermoplasmata archaeon]